MADPAVLDRVAREQEFHDERFAHDEGEARDRFYDFVDGARRALLDATAAFAPGDRVLELGAGLSSTGWVLAERGVEVVAIDISPVAVERARAHAAETGVSIEFAVMNAEDLQFADASFDGVVGSGILHHLDVAASLEEIRRVLRPTGRAVFYEPLGHNPLINVYRRRTPAMRTVDEHPLRRSDFALARTRFRTVEASMHHAAVIACALMPGRLARLVRPILDGVDAVLTRCPGLRWWSWITVMELSGPRAGEKPSISAE